MANSSDLSGSAQYENIGEFLEEFYPNDPDAREQIWREAEELAQLEREAEGGSAEVANDREGSTFDDSEGRRVPPMAGHKPPR